MERNKFVPCEDRIVFDEDLGEMSLERLQTLKALAEMCEDCQACRGIAEMLQKELENRKQKNESRNERVRYV